MIAKYRKFLFLGFLGLANISLSQGQIVDCLGTKVYDYGDSTKYSTLKPWIDTAADTAHYPEIWVGCTSPPGCQPFVNCSSSEGCESIWINARLSGRFVDHSYSLAEIYQVFDIWAATLNAEFDLREVKSFDPFETKALTVDSLREYSFGPWPWLSKSEIVALSKKCYIGYIGLPETLVAVKRNKPVNKKVENGTSIDAKGIPMKAGSPRFKLQLPN